MKYELRFFFDKMYELRFIVKTQPHMFIEHIMVGETPTFYHNVVEFHLITFVLSLRIMVLRINHITIFSHKNGSHKHRIHFYVRGWLPILVIPYTI